MKKSPDWLADIRVAAGFLLGVMLVRAARNMGFEQEFWLLLGAVWIISSLVELCWMRKEFVRERAWRQEQLNNPFYFGREFIQEKNDQEYTSFSQAFLSPRPSKLPRPLQIVVGLTLVIAFSPALIVIRTFTRKW